MKVHQKDTDMKMTKEQFMDWVDRLENDHNRGVYHNPYNIELTFDANADSEWDEYEQLEDRVAVLIECFMSQ